MTIGAAASSCDLGSLHGMPPPTMLAAMRTLMFLLLAAGGCGGSSPNAKTADDKKKEPGNANAPEEVKADRSRCDKSGKKVVELDVNKDGKPDVWKIYQQVVDQGTKVDVLTCKEVDLNFD